MELILCRNLINSYYRHTSFYCTLLYCASQTLHFYKLKVCGNLVLSMSISIIFPTGSDDDGHFLAIKYFKLDMYIAY